MKRFATAALVALGIIAGAGTATQAATLYATYSNDLYTIDPTTGAGNAIADTGIGGQINGLAFSPAAVPLPAGVWLLLSALGGLGFAGWRRKAVAS